VQDRVKSAANIPVNTWRFLGCTLLLVATLSLAHADPLTYLKENPTKCPKKVTLKEPASFNLVFGGKIAGSVTKPAATEVDVVRIVNDQIEVTAGTAQATLPISQTDLLQRVEQIQTAASAQPATAPVAEASPPAASVAPAPTPTAPVATATTPKELNGSPATFESEISPRANFTIANFRLRLLGSDPVKGILVLTPGLNGDGRSAVDSSRWQAIAREFDLALVGSYMQGGGYHQAENGTGEALLDALKDFAKQSGHPELNTVPLILWGHSAGGQFNFNFVSWKPQRVAAFIVNKGGYYSGQPNGQSRKVPGLFFLGTKDSELRINTITDIYEKGRKLGALWALAPEQNVGHEEGSSQEIATLFFQAVLPKRLGSLGKMNDLDERTGWLASPEKKVIEPAATSKFTKSEAGWLPDETTAKAWLTAVGG
jgi:pimeloyl-ACP methyl ester carboxylesterase